MIDSKTARKSAKPLIVVGWQEHVDLPLLGLTNLKAKIDTGARTSALHASDISKFEKDGEAWVRFHTKFDDDAHDLWVECPIHDVREIKNTSGVPEERIIIRTKFRIVGKLWKIDLSLTDRQNMKFRMIVGRTALKNHPIAVHTRQSHLTEKTATEGKIS